MYYVCISLYNLEPPRLDLVLILVGLLALLVIPILAAETGVSFEKLLVVRGLRLFRLVRALRWGRGTKKDRG